MRAMLDDSQTLEVSDDPNDYAVGFIPALDGTGRHAVILTLQKKPANNSAAASASHLLRSFPTVEYVLIVGIAGGVPDPQHPGEHVRLGDVVVSNHYGVIQYDNVKLAKGKIEIRDSSSSPSSSLIGKSNMLEADRLTGKHPWEHYIRRAQQVLPESFRPDESTDQLYSSKYPSKILQHPDDPTRRAEQPRVHFGRIGSANALLKDPALRDDLAEQWSVRAIEMEGSGIADGAWTDSQGYLIIRGICDYCDSHKNKIWQAYAAVAAAAYARSLIELFKSPIDPLKEEVLEAARTKLDEARERSLKSEFQIAEKLCAEACRLASSGGDFELERIAHLRAARSLSQHLNHSSPKEKEGKEVRELINGHINAAESLGAKPGHVVIERLLLARLVDTPDKILRLAAEVDRLADPDDTSDRVEALCGRMEALSRLGRKPQMLALRGEVERMRSAAVGDQRLALEATWLDLLLHAGAASDRDVQTFVYEVESLVEQDLISRKLGATTLSRMTSECSKAGRLDDALTPGISAYQMAEFLDDSKLCATVAAQIAEVAAALGDAIQARHYLGRADSWSERHKAGSSEGSQVTWAALRVSVLFARGRVLTGLALKSTSGDNSVESILFHEAYEALTQAISFAEENRWIIKGDVDLWLADINLCLADVADALGRSEQAAKHYRAVRSESVMANPPAAKQLGMEAWLREAECLRLAGRPGDARRTVDELLTHTTEAERTSDISVRAQNLRTYLDERELPVIDWFDSPEANAIARKAKEVRQGSLRGVVAEQIMPLVEWWNEWREEGVGMEPAFFDLWGRGGFARVAAAIRAKPHSAIAIDATSVEEIRSCARIFCPLFDTVIIKWKGELDSGGTTCAIHESYNGPGGHGYVVAAGSRIRETWAPTVSWSNLIPQNLAGFLAGEALPLVRSGRLLVLPAPLVGCTQRAVGWTDTLMDIGFLRGVVNVGGKQNSTEKDFAADQQILDLTSIPIPFIDNIHMSDLAKVLEDMPDLPLSGLLSKLLEGESIRKEFWSKVRIIEAEITDACSILSEQLAGITRNREGGDWRVLTAEGALSVGSNPGDLQGRDVITDLLRSLASSVPQDAVPWIPYWRLTSLGGHLEWAHLLDNRSITPGRLSLPQPPDVQTWLYPGTPGWRILAVSKSR